MQEISQLERAKLAAKQDPPLRVEMCESSPRGYIDIPAPLFNNPRATYRVHPDDEAKLDAIIWEDADKDEIRAYLSKSGAICFTYHKDNVNDAWSLIATRELPADQYGLVNKSDKGELPC